MSESPTDGITPARKREQAALLVLRAVHAFLGIVYYVGEMFKDWTV